MDTFIKIATIASGFSTMAIALLTFFLLRENSLLRKSGSHPKLVAYFEPHQDGTGGLNIAVANVGTGAAQNVFIQFCGDQDTFAKYDLIMDCSSSIGPLTMIPQGDKYPLYSQLVSSFSNLKDLRILNHYQHSKLS